MINLILADEAAALGGSSFMMMGFLVVCIIGMYVFSSRSQKKRQAKTDAMIASLQVGSAIKTIGGILGTIEIVGEDYFVIKTGEGEQVGYLKIIKNAVYATDDAVAQTKKANEPEVIEVMEVEEDK